MEGVYIKTSLSSHFCHCQSFKWRTGGISYHLGYLFVKEQNCNYKINPYRETSPGKFCLTVTFANGVSTINLHALETYEYLYIHKLWQRRCVLGNMHNEVQEISFEFCACSVPNQVTPVE